MGIKFAVELLTKLKEPRIAQEPPGYSHAASELLVKLARAAELAGVPFSVSVTLAPPGKPAATVRSTTAGICWCAGSAEAYLEGGLVEGLVHDATGLDTLVRRLVEQIDRAAAGVARPEPIADVPPPASSQRSKA